MFGITPRWTACGPGWTPVPADPAHLAIVGCRVSADDLMSLVPGSTSLPLQVGAVLMLDVRSGLDPARWLAALDRRLPGVPRLRQRLLRVPPGCGRPVWVDDPRFRIEDHISVSTSASPLSLAAVLETAAQLVTTPLADDRPLWSGHLVTDVEQHRAALIVVFHHVLADGMAGLAVLASLVDGLAPPPDPYFPRPAPSRWWLARDAAAGHLRSVRQLPRTLRRMVSAIAELAPTAAAPAAPCSLNQVTGPGRCFETVTADLTRVRALAHRHEATVNDVALTVISGALHRLLLERGETLPGLVVSIPFSRRPRTSNDELGNQSGVIPLLLPTVGTFEERLASIAHLTSVAKRTERAASTAVLGPLFRLLATFGLYQRFIDHQRRIHTFASYLRGPETKLSLMGCPVTDIIPLSVAIGNVTVAFTIMSYAGVLTITINGDPLTCPDLAFLGAELETTLQGPGSDGPPSQPGHRSFSVPSTLTKESP